MVLVYRSCLNVCFVEDDATERVLDRDDFGLKSLCPSSRDKFFVYMALS